MANAFVIRSFVIRSLLLRTASVAGIIALSLFFVGLIPFLSAGPSVGAGFPARLPATTVNHEFKGDRLPLFSDGNSVVSKNASKNAASRLQDAKPIPDGCDPAFSPITTPRLANVYGRCTT
jgi:hypothetical protein